MPIQSPLSDGESGEPLPTIALIHVHGIGRQQRFQELSALTDALKQWWLLHFPQQRFELTIRYELQQGGTRKSAIPFYEILLTLAGRQKMVRLYEVYWAPLPGKGPPDREVLSWAIRQWVVPLRRMIADWSQYSYIRSSVLQHLRRERVEVNGAVIQHGELQQLLTLYTEFCDQAFQCSGHPQQSCQGRFTQFMELLEQRNLHNSERLKAITRVWWRRYVLAEWGVVLAVTGICLSLLGAILSALVFLKTYTNANWLNVQWLQKILTGLPDTQPISALSFVSGVFILTYLLFLRTYIREWLGDVKIWVTYQETAEYYQKRRDIQGEAEKVFRHVLKVHPRPSDRVIVLGHSLGSAIAFDTLLSLAGRQMSNDSELPQLEKISHFFTSGSPIDKIHYFFEAQKSNHSVHTEVLRQLRDRPLKYLLREHDQKPLIWYNFYDLGDAVGGPLETPRLPGRVSRIQNIYTANARFATTIYNHAGYVRNRRFVTYLWHAILPELAQQPVLQPLKMPTPHSRHHQLQMRLGQAALLLLTYSSGLGMVTFIWKNELLTELLLIVGMVIGAVCYAGLLYARWCGHSEPIQQAAPPPGPASPAQAAST